MLPNERPKRKIFPVLRVKDRSCPAIKEQVLEWKKEGKRKKIELPLDFYLQTIDPPTIYKSDP